MRAPSPGWFNPHPLRARGGTGPFPGVPRPDSEGPMAPAARTTDSTGSYALVDPPSSMTFSAAGTVDSYMVASQQSVVESQSLHGSGSTPGDTVSEGPLDPYVDATLRPLEAQATGSLPPRHPAGRQAPTIEKGDGSSGRNELHAEATTRIPSSGSGRIDVSD